MNKTNAITAALFAALFTWAAMTAIQRVDIFYGALAVIDLAAGLYFLSKIKESPKEEE